MLYHIVVGAWTWIWGVSGQSHRMIGIFFFFDFTYIPDDRYEGVGMKKQRGTRRTYLHRATQVRHQR